MSASTHKRRAAKHGRAVENFSDAEIFERDGWVCKCGCGVACDRSKVVPHPDAPSLGHIIALACGGDHVRSNVQCERWGCNKRKNNEEDTPRASKIKRQRRDTGQQARRDRRKAEGLPALIQGKTKIESKGFDRSLKKKMNGEVIRRG